MSSLRGVAIGLFVFAATVVTNGQTAPFHTTHPLEFRLAEDAAGPGLIAVHVEGQARVIYLHRDVQLDDRDIRTASVVKDAAGQPAVQVRLRPSGVSKFNAMAKDNQYKTVAIVAKDKVISAPVIDGALVDDVLDITGAFTSAEASALAKALSR